LSRAGSLEYTYILPISTNFCKVHLILEGTAAPVESFRNARFTALGTGISDRVVAATAH